MVKMVELHIAGVVGGAKFAMNASKIDYVAPDDPNAFDGFTRVSAGGTEFLVTEGYHEVLDMIQKTNVVWIDAEGKLVEV